MRMEKLNRGKDLTDGIFLAWLVRHGVTVFPVCNNQTLQSILFVTIRQFSPVQLVLLVIAVARPSGRSGWSTHTFLGSGLSKDNKQENGYWHE